MREIAAILFMVLIAWAHPAQADITAEYFAWGPLGPSLKVQVASNGNARIEIRGETVAILRDGVFYLIRTDDRGSFVIREEEFARIEEQKSSDTDDLPVFPDMSSARLVERGTERVGGRDGTVLDLVGDGDPPSDTTMAYVVSSDPDLAPVGAIIARLFGAGPEPRARADLANLLTQVHARGTVIRMAFMLRLEGTNTNPIPPTAFELPGPELSGEEAEARLGAAW